MKNSEAERLVLENMKLVYYLINKYYPTYTQDEDLQQCGMLALCRAAETWDPDKSQFSTYASKCITNAFNVELRKRSKHYGNLSLDYEYSNGDGEAMTLGDTVVGEEDVEYIDFDRYFKTLSPREKQMVELKLRGCNEMEIARATGWSKVYVYATMRSAKRKWERFNVNNQN